MSVRVTGVTKRHGRGERTVLALDDVELEARSGELVVLVGPSGSGKSSLLRVIAGLDSLDAGRIEVAGRDVTTRPPGQRDVAMVFQDLALYPHLTVAGNLDFDLRASGVSEPERGVRITAVVERLDLGPLTHRRPGELSGGERQRTALARALVRRPSLLLLDEPFSTIDAEHRSTFRNELRTHQRDLELTTIHVTHDTTEAMGLADRIAVLDAGRLVQVGSPEEVWDRPANVTVARRFGDDPINLLAPTLGTEPSVTTIGVRPPDLLLTAPHAVAPPGAVPLGEGEVVECVYLGDRYRVTVRAGGTKVLSTSVPAGALPPVGTWVSLWADLAAIHRFDERGKRLDP